MILVNFFVIEYQLVMCYLILVSIKFEIKVYICNVNIASVSPSRWGLGGGKANYGNT